MAAAKSDAGASFFYSQGKARADDGKWLPAIASYNKALVIQRETLGQNHPEAGQTLHDIGVAFANLGSHRHFAITALKEALYIRKKAFGLGSEEVEETDYNLSLIPLMTASNSDDLRGEKRKLSFMDLLASTVNSKANNPFATWHDGKGKISDERTFGVLWDEAGIIATYLNNDWNVKKGQRVVLCYLPGLHFFAVFLGCLRAGVIAVLVYPPAPPLTKSLLKMMKVVDDCSPVLILLDSTVKKLYNMDQMNIRSKSRDLWPKGIGFKVTDKLSMKKDQNFDVEILSSDTAFLQYTSGSTGDPKGVMVSFGALQANVDLIYSAQYNNCAVSESQVAGFSWLPQYHDAGLILCFIAPFAGGRSMHMMSPIDFLKNPLLWMKLISKHRINWTAGPDFAYNLVARRFREAKENRNGQNPTHGLDLSHIHHFVSCAEPIREETMESFGEVFHEHGLPTSWFSAGYGLAENVVYVSSLNGIHLSVPRDEDLKPLVAVGSKKNFHPSLDIKIVCPEALTEMPNNKTGELWLSGPTVAVGYYGKPQLTKLTFHAKMVGSEVEFLRTGHLAFFQHDKLFICGRIKDVIISNGVNYYPQDIEFAVQNASTSVRPGCIAAFSSNDTSEDGVLEIVFEIRAGAASNASEVCSTVRENVLQQIGLPPSRIVAIKERSINKTTSGKIQRGATRTALHNDKLIIVHNWEKVRRTTHLNDPAQTVEDSLAGLHVAHSHKSVQIGNSCVEGENTGKGIQDVESSAAGNIDQFQEVLVSFFGNDLDSDQNWDERGLTSQTSIELRDSIVASCSVRLSSDCFDLYKTPSALKSYILKNQGRKIPTKLVSLPEIKSAEASWLVMGILQALGSALLLLLFSFSIIPAWYAGQWIANVRDQWFLWVLIPVPLPVWMLSFSLSVIVCKWIIIGQYREGEMKIPSIAYVRWWWVDRAMHLWEFWVGLFIKDTPLIWLFYRLLGAKIHCSAQVKAFIREFDLVVIGEKAVLEHQLRCRKFRPWEEGGEGPLLHFRAILVEESALVRGVLCPGVWVGEGACVDYQAVVQEGAQIPREVVTQGNPAFIAGTALPYYECCWWKIGILKIAWIIAELYIRFGLLLVGQFVLQGHLPTDWRYTPLLQWFLVFMQLAVLSIATSIILKWILIGHCKPGPKEDNIWKSAADWVVDYDWRISILLLYSVSFGSRLWNFILMLYGMDVDFASKVDVEYFPPSKVDLISVKRSFISNFQFEIQQNGRLDNIEVSESSIALGTHIRSGVKLLRAVVAPLTDVTEDITREELDERFNLVNSFQLFTVEVKCFLGFLVLIAAVFASMIPSYEVWVSVLPPSSVWSAVPVLSLALTLQTISWLLLLFMIQLVTFGCSTKHRSPWDLSVYAVYHVTVCSVQRWSFLPVLWGSVAFNAVAKMLGATFEGSALNFGYIMYDFPYITISDRTVLDEALVTGHFGIYGNVSLGPTFVSGVLHQGTFAMAHAVLSDKESGPKHACVGAVSTLMSESDGFVDDY